MLQSSQQHQDKRTQSKKLTRVSFILFFLVVLPVLVGFMPVSHPVRATPTGSLELSNDNVVDKAIIVVTCKSLTVSTPYGLYQGSTAIANFTTSATETERSFYVKVSKDADNIITIYLYSAATKVDSRDVTVNAATDLVPAELLVTVFASIFVIVLIATILRRVRG